MSYTVRVYKNTGFNKNNIPDRPALLDTCVYIDLPAIDVIQDRVLQSISVKATYTQIKDADYVKIGNSQYYIVSGAPVMTSSDVATIPLLFDYLLSAGGIVNSNLKIADGITERFHPRSSDDVFGAFPGYDALMTPCDPLVLHSEFLKQTTPYYTFVETVLDLEAMSSDDSAETYTDPVSGETVTVPQTIPASSSTSYSMNSVSSDAAGTKVYRYFDGAGAISAKIRDGISKAFALGIQNGGVINKVRMPYGSITVVMDDLSNSNGVASMSSQAVTLTPTDTAFNFAQFSGHKNKKLEYSDLCNYGIMSTSGEQVTFDPQSIYVSGATSPTITEWDDPHLNGKPYFRFSSVEGDSSFAGFWKNCISGLQWKQVPMVFTEKQGSAIDKIKYSRDMYINEVRHGQQKIEGVIGTAAGMAQGAISGANAGGIVGGLVGGLTQFASGMWQQGKQEALYQDEKLRQVENFALSQRVVQPQVQFPYNSDVIRDFMGNGVLMYRYLYSAADAARIDNLLCMYGYEFHKKLEKNDFLSRSKFNYVKATNVSFTCDMFPQWMLNGMAMQVQGGVRVWHVLPDVAQYNYQTNTNT